MQCQSLMCTRLVMLDCRRKKKIILFYMNLPLPCDTQTQVPFHLVWMYVCACAYTRLQTQTQLQETNPLFLSDSHKSFRLLPLARLHASVGQIRPGNHRWPQHSRPGNTQLHLDCCLCTDTDSHVESYIFQLQLTQEGSCADY